MDSNEEGQGRSQHIEERIVIVGGGIGGLACALALHRVGLRAVVLEQSDTLRATGTCLSLWTNSMRVLDVLGIGEKFRTMYHNVLEIAMFNERGRCLARTVMADCEGGPHELRPVERKVLLESLAGELPAGTIRFKSRVTGIEKSETTTGVTDIHLQDGSIYSAQVVLGFDGQKSVVASWMGLEPAQLVGLAGIRGMAVFPDGHKFGDKGNYFVGRGVRSSMLTINDTKVYWFVIWNDWGEGFRDTAPEQLKAEALSRVKAFQSRENIELCINHTPPEHFTKNSIHHRINTLPPASQVIGGVTLGGDASHPTAPSLGQGGGMALEDAILLTQRLFPVLNDGGSDPERIHAALVAHQEERHARTHALTVRAYRAATVMQSDWSVVCLIRDWFLIPYGMNPKSALDHTHFDVGKLPVPAPDPSS